MNWWITESPRPARIARWPGARWLVIGTVCFGAFMGQLDASIVTLAFPAMAQHFGATPGQIEWVSLAYLITLVALLAPTGRFADRAGRKLIYMYGFIVFTVASAFCALAPNLDTLVTARILQAVGAAMLQANSVALVVTNVPRDRMRTALGIQTAAQALGLALGPILGGVLVSTFGWQAVFAINVPIGLVALVAGHYLLPRTRDVAARLNFRPNREVLKGLAGVFVTYALLFAPMTILPFTTDKPLQHIGFLVAVLPIGFALAATLLPSFTRTTGAALSTVAGLVALTPLPTAVWLLLLGIGLGIIAPASSKAVMANVPADQAGVGSGLVNTARGLGTAAGVAAATWLLHLTGI